MSRNHCTERIALQDVMLNYAAAVDERNLERYRACFTDDVEVVGFGTQAYRGREAWESYVWNALQKYSASQHLLGPQLATIDGDEAQTRTDVQALHFLADADTRLTLWGTYRTELVEQAAGWCMERHELLVRATRMSDAFES